MNEETRLAPTIGFKEKRCRAAMCTGQTAKNSEYCTHHHYLADSFVFKDKPNKYNQCLVPECQSPHESGSPYCKDHNRKCESTNCHDPALESLRYCKYHMEENSIFVEEGPKLNLSSLTPAGQFAEDVFQICLEVKDILQKKNQDYGNSAHEQFMEYGPMSYNLRIEDKLRRLKHLASNPPEVTEEKIEETILDLIGYGTLYLKSVREVKEDGRKQSTATISS